MLLYFALFFALHFCRIASHCMHFCFALHQSYCFALHFCIIIIYYFTLCLYHIEFMVCILLRISPRISVVLNGISNHQSAVCMCIVQWREGGRGGGGGSRGWSLSFRDILWHLHDWYLIWNFQRAPGELNAAFQIKSLLLMFRRAVPDDWHQPTSISICY